MCSQRESDHLQIRKKIQSIQHNPDIILDVMRYRYLFLPIL